jgi:hypothetical protein
MSKPDSTQTSFLFSLKNPHTSEAKKFSMKSSSNAICCHSEHGPGFGSNHDICVHDRCNESTSNGTSLEGAYVNDTGINGKHVFTGERRMGINGLRPIAVLIEYCILNEICRIMRAERRLPPY